MKESTEQEFKNFEDDPETFGLLLEFMHTGSIDSDGENPPEFDQFVSLWLLGDFLQNIEVQNYCTWRLICGYDEGLTISPAKLGALYRTCPKTDDNVIRNFIVDVCVWTEIDMTAFDDPAVDMLIEALVKYQAKSKGDVESPLNDVNNYYVFPPAEPIEPTPDSPPEETEEREREEENGEESTI